MLGVFEQEAFGQHGDILMKTWLCRAFTSVAFVCGATIQKYMRGLRVPSKCKSLFSISAPASLQRHVSLRCSSTGGKSCLYSRNWGLMDTRRETACNSGNFHSSDGMKFISSLVLAVVFSYLGLLCLCYLENVEGPVSMQTSWWSLSVSSERIICPAAG